MTQREQFEAWAESQEFSVTKYPMKEVYRSLETTDAWFAWQAAQAAQEPVLKRALEALQAIDRAGLELDEYVNLDEVNLQSITNEAIVALTAALEKA